MPFKPSAKRWYSAYSDDASNSARSASVSSPGKPTRHYSIIFFFEHSFVTYIKGTGNLVFTLPPHLNNFLPSFAILPMLCAFVFPQLFVKRPKIRQSLYRSFGPYGLSKNTSRCPSGKSAMAFCKPLHKLLFLQLKFRGFGQWFSLGCLAYFKTTFWCSTSL